MRNTILTLIALALVSCASSEPKYHSAQTAPTSRDAFVEYAENQLEGWENRVDDMSGQSKHTLQPMVSDLKMELSALKSTDKKSLDQSRWISYRDRINTSLGKLQNQYRMRAE